MLCRLEVLCGKDQHSSEFGGGSPQKFSADSNSGPAAVVRNLHEVLPPPTDGVFHTVVTDRFYTSVLLALQLLSRNVYSIGTIQPNRAGFSTEVTTKSKTRPLGVATGSTKVAVAKAVPELACYFGDCPLSLIRFIIIKKTSHIKRTYRFQV
ncbi:unnamed protein product [Phytophthora fragariaefolia]|uniref:Unnamed protein product n=1 Tax=Phytophthora fragariaefolia TaxID=1490495 RepID=A0A9W6U8E8_9STRA|nr:unnamed protein product [Phytophthora fragariaefolia]